MPRTANWHADNTCWQARKTVVVTEHGDLSEQGIVNVMTFMRKERSSTESTSSIRDGSADKTNNAENMEGIEKVANM